jgi:hypothetical protein
MVRRAIIRATFQQAQRSVLASYTDQDGLADATAAALGCDKAEVLDVVRGPHEPAPG